MNADPRAALEALSTARDPFLIGVRHHSPVLAAAVPALLDALAPELVLIELPEEFQSWLPWLGNPELEAPVALGGARPDSPELAFYPFADFSPELAAIRWAVAKTVAVEAFDLPVAWREPAEREPRDPPKGPTLMDGLVARTGAEDFEDVWDRLVEVRSSGDAEATRRAALLVGWAHRVDAAEGPGVPLHDRRREAHMRARLDESRKKAKRIAVVVGAFHASALLPAPMLFEAPSKKKKGGDSTKVVTSLIPYSSELLDSRSGYPAGIHDPLWQQAVWSAARDGTDLEHVLSHLVVQACREVRGLGHVAGVPDAKEAVRLASDLARLRGLPAPGRRELLESFQSAVGRGELLGRGRILARALDRVLVGRQRGRLPAGAPRSGLAPHVEEKLASLKLPGPAAAGKDPVQLRLDPLRSDLDRDRHVVLEQLQACGIPYGARREGMGPTVGETLTEVWEIAWTPSTEALLELAGTRGVTLEQASRGAVLAEEARLRRDEKYTTQARLEGLRVAAACGLVDVVTSKLEELMGPFVAEAGLVELVQAHLLLERLERGHEPSLAGFALPPTIRRSELLAATLRALEGLSGSNRLEDARAILELVRLFERQPRGPDEVGGGALGWTLDRLAREGSPLVQGAAGAARVLLAREAALAFGDRMGSWVDAAVDGASRRTLARRLTGALTVASPLFESEPAFSYGLLDRVEVQDDTSFLARVPALREGFEALSPAARERLLQELGTRLGGQVDAQLEESPALLAVWTESDHAGREAVKALGLLEPTESLVRGATLPKAGAARTLPRTAGHAISSVDRWRLILGRERDRLTPRAGRAATALDELYGQGHGEGSRSDLGGRGGGREAGFPSVREWAGELEELFGASVREEVLGRAVERGQLAAALELDPEKVTPSVELLEQVLSLKGGLGEAQLGRLRRLVERIVDALVQELAIRLRPSLSGLSTPRPTRRPGGPLDLKRTIQANLSTLRRAEDGSVVLVPEKPIFQTVSRRTLDWRVILVVDVSGSMEESVIYSAIMGAIIASLPAFSVSFLAFSDEVIDLSTRVSDPLGLLLEVKVGGGTHIAKALRYARELITVPKRTIVLTVTDFEEGWPIEGLLGEVRAIVETGATALGLAALDDRGQPRYNRASAELVAAAGMPVAALTPLELAKWIGEKVRS